jgi:hypothetical protein
MLDARALQINRKEW